MPPPKAPSRPNGEYHVGWITALHLELAAARAMLDEIHGPPQEQDTTDENTYCLGRIQEHNIVIACLPEYGTNAAAVCAKEVLQTFKNIRFGLMVGIGGGVPSLEHDIRLGDVVVSVPERKFPGVVQFDLGKQVEDGRIQTTGSLDRPPPSLLTALKKVRANHVLEDTSIPQLVEAAFSSYPKIKMECTSPGSHCDLLFEETYEHKGPTSPPDCDPCDTIKLVRRTARKSDIPSIHYGTIASGNVVMRNGATRSRVARELGALCFEMEAAGLMNNFKCLVIRGICDYADSHKNKRWQGYAAITATAYAKELLTEVLPQQVRQEPAILQVADVIKEHVQTTSDHYREQEIRYQNDQDRKCHLVFKLDNYEQQKNINPNQAPGTCQWVLGNKKYIDWKRSSTDGLLWISADPGCGKSVLSKFLVDQELQGTSTHTVCYFFFKDNEQQDRLSIALCALLHQLFDSQRHLLRYATAAYEKNGDKLNQEEGELWRILLAATADSKALNVTCVLDALDECRGNDRWRLIDMLSQFHVKSSLSQRQNNWLKFLVTSRPYDDIQRTFQTTISSMPAIRLRGEDENEQIRKEIDIVIKEKVLKLAEELQLKPETTTRLERKLLQMEHRTYLWLYLTIDHIYNTYKESLRPDDESIESLPSSVEAAYEKLLERITTGVKDKVKMILQAVVGVRRPLTIGEMALTLDITTSLHLESAADSLIKKDHLEQNIRNWCGLFIFINDSKIYLIHQTAREFLICESSAIGTGWKHCFEIATTETYMSRICVRFLLSKQLNDISHELVITDLSDLCTWIWNRSTGNDIEKFLLYSAEHWPSHLRSSEIGENDSIMTEVQHLYDTGNERCQLWFRLFWATTYPYRRQPEMNELRLAAFNGHEKVVGKILIDENVDVNGTDRDGHTPLIWASLKDHKKVVQILLDQGAEVNAQGGLYSNALQAASQGGHEKVVQILLNQGAEVNTQGGLYGNALQAASQGGHEKVVQILLDQGAEVNAQGGHYSNALQAASQGGHEKVVQILLNQGAEVNAQGGHYSNALQAASQGGHEKVVQILLNQGAEVNAQGGLYSNALQAASQGGHEKVVQILLDQGAEVNAQGGLYGNVLQAASVEGHEKVIHILLDSGAEVSGKAIQAASERGHKSVMQILQTRQQINHSENGDYARKKARLDMSARDM